MTSIVFPAAVLDIVPETLLSWGINPYQSLVDMILLVFTLYVLWQKPEKPEKPLTSEEIEQLIDEWVPEPLVPAMNPQLILDSKVPTITGTNATHAIINNKPCLNLVRTNFLGMISNPRVEESSRKAIYKYGVGTCGPRGFYGTIDAHLELEKRIKDFLDAEDCLIYSYGFATPPSVIPAFSGRGDLLIVDSGCTLAIQIGVNLARSDVMWFKHNDMEDLERVLKSVQQKDIQTKRKITRRFIVFEGVYYNTGTICNLPKIMELKNKYKYRLIMEDSIGVGVLGKKGKGTCEHFNVPVKDVDILCGSLSKITGSVGGFCCGSKSIVYHQRLNSAGYVYSASLPPLLAVASHTAFDMLEEDTSALDVLRANTDLVYKGLSNISGMSITSNSIIPVIHLRIAKPYENRIVNEYILQQIVDEALANGIFITRAKYSQDEKKVPDPSIRICVSASHTPEQIKDAIDVIHKASVKALAEAPAIAAKEPVIPDKKAFRRIPSAPKFN